MTVYRFDTMREFESALSGTEADYGRFTQTSQSAANSLGLSAQHINQLVRLGAIDCVIVD